MSAPEEVKKLGILAGGGALPGYLARSCAAQGIAPFIICFEGQDTDDWYKAYAHEHHPLGAAGAVIKSLKAQGINNLVLIGSIKRPSLKDLKPDLKAASFFAKYGAASLGDDGLLSGLRKFLEDEGFTLHAVQDFAPALLTSEGVLSKYKPSKDELTDIARGFEISQTLGQLDVGQSVVVQEGLVLGVEAIEGTAALIERCAMLKRKGRKPILIKSCKPQQDRALDLPTIGPDTIEQLAEAGFGGLALHAGQSLFVEQEQALAFAAKYKIFVIGVNP